MKIFVDFDNTIFDTKHEFRDEVSDIFYKYGISKELRQKTLDKFSSIAQESGLCYSPREHIKIINKITGKNINEEVFVKEIDEFLENLEEFVFEDFYQFVNLFHKKNLIILTYGEYNFQLQKVEGSGVMQFFEDVIVTNGSKTKEIEKYMKNFSDENVVLIDDKQEYFTNAKKSNINIQTIHILRNDEQCGNDENCDFDVSNLREISDIIK